MKLFERSHWENTSDLCQLEVIKSSILDNDL